MTINPEVTVGDLLTSISVIVAMSGLLFAYFQERSRKHKEYAENIRQSAALVAVKLERIGKLALAYYDQIQWKQTDFCKR